MFYPFVLTFIAITTQTVRPDFEEDPLTKTSSEYFYYLSEESGSLIVKLLFVYNFSFTEFRERY